MEAVTTDKLLAEARGLFKKSRFSHALPIFQKLVQRYSHDAQIWFEYGCAASAAGQSDLADRAWHQAAKLDPGNGQLMLQMGHQCQFQRFPEKARTWFEKAANVDPKAINPRLAVAMLLEQSHRFAEARKAIAECLAIDPKDDQARYFVALLDRRENRIEEAESRMRDLMASGPQHQYVQYASRYELAEVLDRTGRHDEAMKMLLEAKELQRRLGDMNALLQIYDGGAGLYRCSTQELPKNILNIWGREFPERAREVMPRMAFLGGHPRSGTTLLEQILGAHPKVAALDEPLAFTAVACPLFHASPQLSRARLNVIRRRYLEAIQKEWGGSMEGKLLLDKNPSPTARLRIWLRVFPELPVIIALRDPRDVVISCFFQNLLLNEVNANFLSLERTAIHYANLMDVWLAVRQWEGLSWLETRYEDTVADVEKEGRRVTNFLGLEWDPGQVRYHENNSKRQMYSPTYHDARQPVYARSVARWRAYEKYLKPVLPILEPYCRAFGYS